MINEGITVLIVDDNEENRDILSRRLKSDGFNTITAVNGKEAMDILNENIVHITLLDIMMPEVDIVTVAQECLRLGACGYITKPYDMDMIKQKIRECLKMKPRLVED